MDEIKQIIIVRKDLKMTKGKMSAQVAHAAVEAYRKARDLHPTMTKQWLNQGAKKVVLYIENKGELLELMKKIPPEVPSKLIIDAGRTQLEPGTITCLGIGPYESSEIDKITSELKLVD